MFSSIKNWIVNVVSNGGVALILIAGILLGGAAGHVAHDPVSNLFSANAPAAQAPIPDTYECPSDDWVRFNGYDDSIGSTYTTCEYNKVVIRHFDNKPPLHDNLGEALPPLEQTQAMDRGVYPFNTELTVEEAIEIANSR